MKGDPLLEYPQERSYRDPCPVQKEPDAPEGSVTSCWNDTGKGMYAAGVTLGGLCRMQIKAQSELRATDVRTHLLLCDWNQRGGFFFDKAQPAWSAVDARGCVQYP